jgi:Zn-dependent protease with chaperone function
MSTPVAAGSQRFGPRNPETFFAAQKRNRRATWRMSALSAFAAFIMGIPLTLVLTPLLYAMALIAADIYNYFSPLPPEFWQNAKDLAQFGIRVADYIVNQRGTVSPQELAIGLSLILLPGMILAFLLWMGMLLMFRHGGVGGALASLNAREPDQSDLKELQLADVLQEMAIAAGVPAPRLMLIDSPGANAAVIGSSAADARIVLSRRLLDDLNRDQLQAVLGHLIGAIGNGDLRIAFAVTSVFETCGLMVNMINVPFGKESRVRLWRIVRYLFSRGSSQEKSVLANEIAESLASSLDSDASDMNPGFPDRQKGFFRKLFSIVFFPLIFTNLGVELTLWLFTNILLGPCMALLWRTRRYLADASSVELTRNPDAMASALQRLSEDTNAVTGGEWASHLFLVDPKGDRSMRGAVPTEDQKDRVLKAWAATATANLPADAASPAAPVAGTATNDYARFRSEMMATALRAAGGDASAIARMQAMAQAMGSDADIDLHNMPNPADIMAARQGDKAALARIQKLRQTRTATRQQSQSGLQMASMISFHPPLKRRAKRLQRMGSHILTPGGSGWGLRIAMTVLWLIIGPLLAVAGAAMLLVMGIVIMFNLVLLTVWLTVIHWAFGQDWVANFNGFVNFVNALIRAFSKR